MGNVLEGLGFLTMFETSADALLLAGEKGDIFAANPAAQQMLGYSAAEICNLNVEMLMPEKSRAAHRHYLQHYMGKPVAGAKRFGKELIALCQDGREVPMDISLTPMQGHAKPCVLVTLVDATARRRAEDALRQSEVQVANMALTVNDHHVLKRKLRHRRGEDTLLSQQVAVQTATAIAHELNQPLAAVSAYSEVALHELINFDCPEKLRRALQGCAEQAQRAGHALHELLKFLHKTDFDGELAPCRLDINELVAEAVAAAQHDGMEAFCPELDLEQALPEVMVNRIQVQRILTNLVRNGVEAARDAGLSGSEIRIRVQTDCEFGMARVTVQDNGPGLDGAMDGKLFTPFFTTKSNGIGMGLAISQALAKANGGQLWADPAANPGATFHLTLPFAL